jgi:aspartyl aminopeptidase
MVRTNEGKFERRLVKVDRPILRIPTLAIHLERQEKFEYNKEGHLYPIAGLVAAELNRQGMNNSGDTATAHPEETKPEDVKEEFNPLKIATQRHHPYIVELIAEEAGCSPSDIVDFEILIYDTQKSCIGGLNDEFIFSARLDNLAMSFCALQGLLNSVSSPSALNNDHTIRMIALFDHEEIGSRTAPGADSNLLPAVLKRISSIPGISRSDESYEKLNYDADTSTTYEQTLSRSFLISADMAHSIHPNYPDKYEQSHRPEMNQGVVIKINANARYATNAPGIVLMQEAARRAKPNSSYPSSSARRSERGEKGVPLQLFVVRNDSNCGSTIGPMLSAALGARTVDVGNPQLSMHSIRETGGVHDLEHAVNLFESFFENFGELEEKIVVD